MVDNDKEKSKAQKLRELIKNQGPPAVPGPPEKQAGESPNDYVERRSRELKQKRGQKDGDAKN